MGAVKTTEVDTSQLAPSDANAVESLVADALQSADKGTPGADKYQYDVSITSESGSQTKQFFGDPSPGSKLMAALELGRH